MSIITYPTKQVMLADLHIAMFNRRIEADHVEKMQAKILKHGNLRDLIITEDNYIIDGQHLWEALKNVGETEATAKVLDFTFAADPDRFFNTVIGLNTNSKNWKDADFLYSHFRNEERQGIKGPYTYLWNEKNPKRKPKILDLRDTLKVWFGAKSISGGNNYNMTHEFRTGAYDGICRNISSIEGNNVIDETRDMETKIVSFISITNYANKKQNMTTFSWRNTHFKRAIADSIRNEQMFSGPDKPTVPYYTKVLANAQHYFAKNGFIKPGQDQKGYTETFTHIQNGNFKLL